MPSRASWKHLLVASLAFLAFWFAIGAPTTFNEYRFMHRLADVLKSNPETLDMKTLMPGNWDLVCNAHGYGGDTYLPKYDRTYPAAGALQDGAWGLNFIYPDGSYAAASGDCNSASVYFSLAGCTERKAAIATRSPYYKTCSAYSYE